MGGSVPRMRCLVSIPVRDRVELVSDLVERLSASGGQDEILLADNNPEGSPASLEMVKLEERGLLTRWDADGRNLHEMWNAGLDYGRDFDTVLTLNSDVGEFSFEMVRRLSESLLSDPTIGVICPRYDQRDGKGVIDVSGGCGNRYNGTGGVAGFAFMLRGDSKYRFPEELRWWYGDTHMFECMDRIGARTCMDLDVSLHHIALGGSPGSGDWTLKRDEILLDQKWWTAWKKANPREAACA